MAAEHNKVPDWAQRDRRRDLEWIGENLHVFSPAADGDYAAQGRGALVVDTTSRPTGQGHPFDYIPQELIKSEGDDDIKRIVQEYDPEREFVVVMLKPDERVSTYRVQARRRR